MTASAKTKALANRPCPAFQPVPRNPLPIITIMRPSVVCWPSIEGITKPYDPNPVVSELEVRPGKLISRHVAGDTPRNAHRTGRRRALSRRELVLGAAV